MKPIIAILGPTACGKTDLALKLASEFPVEIISVDSAMVYRGMDIGTAKPDQKIPHHLIDIRDPEQYYSVGDFLRDVKILIPEIQARGKMPLLVGGTMLYFHALQKGLHELPKQNTEVRQKLHALSSEEAWQRLGEVDPIMQAKLHANDRQRVFRALEIYTLTGKPMSALQQIRPAPLFENIQYIGIVPQDRDNLKLMIRQRFLKMLEQGFIDEVKKLQLRPKLNLDTPAMRAVGYRQVWQYLNSEMDYETMVEKAIHATEQLAKRQYTWLKRLQFQKMNFIK